MNTKYWIIVTLIVTGAALYLEHAYFPRVVTVEKQVIKEVTVTTTHQVQHPDGTIVTDSVTSATKKEQIDKFAPIVQPNWVISGGIDMLSSTRVYTLQVQRRVLGPIFVGAQAGTDQRVSINIGVMF